jgi:hypothetical protein
MRRSECASNVDHVSLRFTETSHLIACSIKNLLWSQSFINHGFIGRHFFALHPISLIISNTVHFVNLERFDGHLIGETGGYGHE